MKELIFIFTVIIGFVVHHSHTPGSKEPPSLRLHFHSSTPAPVGGIPTTGRPSPDGETEKAKEEKLPSIGIRGIVIAAVVAAHGLLFLYIYMKLNAPYTTTRAENRMPTATAAVSPVNLPLPADVPSLADVEVAEPQQLAS